MSAKASGGNIWDPDDEIEEPLPGHNFLKIALFFVPIILIVFIWLFFIPALHGYIEKAEKNSDKNASLSIPVTHFKDMA